MKHNIAEDEALEQAALYALGALTREEALSFEEHLAGGCEVCRSELAPFEGVVATLGFAVQGQAPPPGTREKLLARLAAQRPDLPAASHDAGALQFLIVRAAEGEWCELSPGVHMKRLFADEATSTVTSLYKMLPGAHIPMHAHKGIEQCFVIEGDCRINDEVLGPGDFTCAMSGSIHDTLHTQGGTMFLIVAQHGYEVLEPHR
jgi:anti-sigma factor ChrR (cupin superfamily)